MSDAEHHYKFRRMPNRNRQNNFDDLPRQIISYVQYLQFMGDPQRIQRRMTAAQLQSIRRQRTQQRQRFQSYQKQRIEQSVELEIIKNDREHEKETLQTIRDQLRQEKMLHQKDIQELNRLRMGRASERINLYQEHSHKRVEGDLSTQHMKDEK